MSGCDPVLSFGGLKRFDACGFPDFYPEIGANLLQENSLSNRRKPFRRRLWSVNHSTVQLFIYAQEFICGNSIIVSIPLP
jgi:hypothetical protein